MKAGVEPGPQHLQSVTCHVAPFGPQCGMRLTVELHVAGPIHLHIDGVDGDALRKILHNTERLITMSGTLAEQLAAAQAATAASLDAIATDVTEIGADVDSLLAQLQPGTAITQAMVDAATSISGRVGAVKDGLDAINAKVPPTPPTV